MQIPIYSNIVIINIIYFKLKFNLNILYSILFNDIKLTQLQIKGINLVSLSHI